MTRFRTRIEGRKVGKRGGGRIHRAVLTVLAMCLVGFAAQVGTAPVAAAADPQDYMEGPVRKACLYIPEDIWGFFFSFYCVDKDEKGVTKNEHGRSLTTGDRSGYVNGGLKDCGSLADGGIQSSLDNATHTITLGLLVGEDGTVSSCTKKRMFKFMQDHQTSNNLGQSIKADVKENPCNSIYDWDPRSDKNLNTCRSPVGQNPCLLIGTGQFKGDSKDSALVTRMRKSCLDDHKDFKQQSLNSDLADDGGCQFLSGDAKKDCVTMVTENAKAAPTSETVRVQLSNFLGWALLAASSALWLGVIGVGAGMARSWYTGEPGLLQFNRLGWVVFAAVLAGSATSVAGWFML